MKKAIIIATGVIQGIILTMLFSSGLSAQYTAAIGMRTGGTRGVTAKYFYKPAVAADGILGTFENGFSLTALIEKYDPIYVVRGLYGYYGAGTHLAIYNGNSRYDRYYNYIGRDVASRKANELGFGINIIFGVEYRMPYGIPLIFTVDMKPFVEVGTGGHVSVAPDPSVGIKFMIR